MCSYHSLMCCPISLQRVACCYYIYVHREVAMLCYFTLCYAMLCMLNVVAIMKTHHIMGKDY